MATLELASNKRGLVKRLRNTLTPSEPISS